MSLKTNLKFIKSGFSIYAYTCTHRLFLYIIHIKKEKHNFTREAQFEKYKTTVWIKHTHTHARTHARTHAHTHTHPFNCPLSGTTRVSRYQKGKTSLDFTEARDSEWQWHQLGHIRVFQFGQKKVSIRFDSRYRIDFFRFDSIRQSDKFAACTLIFK